MKAIGVVIKQIKLNRIKLIRIDQHLIIVSMITLHLVVLPCWLVKQQGKGTLKLAGCAIFLEATARLKWPFMWANE